MVIKLASKIWFLNQIFISERYICIFWISMFDFLGPLYLSQMWFNTTVRVVKHGNNLSEKVSFSPVCCHINDVHLNMSLLKYSFILIHFKQIINYVKNGKNVSSCYGFVELDSTEMYKYIIVLWHCLFETSSWLNLMKYRDTFFSISGNIVGHAFKLRFSETREGTRFGKFEIIFQQSNMCKL